MKNLFWVHDCIYVVELEFSKNVLYLICYILIHVDKCINIELRAYDYLIQRFLTSFTLDNIIIKNTNKIIRIYLDSSGWHISM